MDETHTTLDEAASEKASTPHTFRLLSIEPVELLRLGGFATKIDRFRRLSLHAKRKLVAGDPRLQLGVTAAVAKVTTIEFAQEVEFLALAADLGLELGCIGELVEYDQGPRVEVM